MSLHKLISIKQVHSQFRNIYLCSIHNAKIKNKKNPVEDGALTTFKLAYNEDCSSVKDISQNYLRPKELLQQIIDANIFPRYTTPDFVSVGPDHDLIFRCTISTQKGRFVGFAKNKKESEITAILKILQTVNKDSRGIIDLLASQRKNRKTTFRPINEKTYPINIPNNELISEKVPVLMNEYNNEILPKITAEMEKLDEYFESPRGNYDGQSCLMTNKPFLKFNEGNNDWLLRKLEKRPATIATMPIELARDEIANVIENNDISLITADTGCGKSLKVPQIIFDQWCSKNRGAECNIIVCQPRRIAAEAIALRICTERGETVGDCVGYAMRMNNMHLNKTGGIMFYTSGTLKEVLAHRGVFKGISHLIIDEVHERSADIDMLLAMVRDFISKEKVQFKIVFMSATANISHIQNLFDLRDEGMIKITAPHTFKVRRRYLEETLENLKIDMSPYQLAIYTDLDNEKSHFYYNIISAIHKNKAPGAILMFLNGWQDILNLMILLQSKPDLHVVPMHSRLGARQIEDAFNPAPKGKRKVVLSTNIAQTSITITDIVYVVDNGQQNQSRIMQNMGIQEFGTYFISQSCAQQRAGRAGRVQDGEAFHLYSSDHHDSMVAYPIADVEAHSFEDILFKTLLTGTPPMSWCLFSDTITKEKVEASLELLANLSLIIFKAVSDSYEVTPLGRVVGSLGFSYNNAKPLLMAYLFGNPNPLINLMGMEMMGQNKSLLGTISEDKESLCDVHRISNIANRMQQDFDSDMCYDNELQSAAGKYERQIFNIKRRLNTVTDNMENWSRGSKEEETIHLSTRFGSIPQTDIKKDLKNELISIGCLLSANTDLIRVRNVNGKCRPIMRDSSHIFFSNKSCLHKHTFNQDTLIMSLAAHFVKKQRIILCNMASVIDPLTASIFYGNKASVNESSSRLSIDKSDITYTSDKSTLEGIRDVRFLLQELILFICHTNEKKNEKRPICDETISDVFRFLHKVTTLIDEVTRR